MKVKRVLGMAGVLAVLGSKAAWCATTGIAAVDLMANGAIAIGTHGVGGVYTIRGIINTVHAWHEGDRGDILRGGAGAMAGFATYGATTISTALGGPAGAMIHAHAAAHLPWAMRLLSHLLG